MKSASKPFVSELLTLMGNLITAMGPEASGSLEWSRSKVGMADLALRHAFNMDEFVAVCPSLAKELADELGKISNVRGRFDALTSLVDSMCKLPSVVARMA